MRVVEERRQRTRRSVGIRKKVKEAYIPLHRELFNKSGEINLLKKKPTKVKDDIYLLPLLTDSTCEQILEELKSFQSSKLPSSPPTPPHTQGSFLYELGMDSLVEKLRERRLFPSLVGDSGLDSCRAFTV